MLCEYSEIFGKVNQGVHSIRILNIAIVDVLLTILLAYLINKKLKMNLNKLIVILIFFSIFIHKLFCVDTTLTLFFFKKN